MKLVIVESPTKAATIEKFLGGEYQVESSYGHIRDLPKSKLGVDVEADFEPQYVIPTKVRKRVNELKKLVHKADEVILATDEDREGEAISWHLSEALGLGSSGSNPPSGGQDPKTKRIVFHEITKNAIQHAVENPRKLDMNLVNAQQARRVLDRLVGYELSPFLWKKLFRGLSAGRVQSAAVKFIADREAEIKKFKPDEYWTLKAFFEKFSALLTSINGKKLGKLEINSEDGAKKILSDLKSAGYIVKNIEHKERKRQPSPPFRTSTLQQASSNRLGFSSKQTMSIAQKLYERGYITYMRTDSVNMSGESLSAACALITEKYGKEYSLPKPRVFTKSTKGAQEAHEAIRPTDPQKTPDSLPKNIDERGQKLYELIWGRFMACQMQEARLNATTVDVEAIGESNRYGFRANGQTIIFEGWLKAYPTSLTEKILPEVQDGEELKLKELKPEQHFTEPPPRYSEASLVKALEEFGIGRPSTYAPIISTITGRNYVVKNDARRFEPTETGILVNDLLSKHFPNIVDADFTAAMEQKLDGVADGTTEWRDMMQKFYAPFHSNLEKKYDEVEKKIVEEKTEEVCEKCGKPMVVKFGKFGKFLACSGFPDCKNAKNLGVANKPEKIGMKCPTCGAGDVVVKRTRRRRVFYGCSEYPDCDYASWKNPLER